MAASAAVGRHSWNSQDVKVDTNTGENQTLKISTVPMSEIEKARKQSRTRARSEETERLVDAIRSLQAGQAKAIELEEGEDIRKIRAKVAYASRLAGYKIRTVAEVHRVLFTRARAKRPT